MQTGLRPPGTIRYGRWRQTLWQGRSQAVSASTATCGLILSIYRREVTTHGGSLQFRIATFIEATGQKAAILLASGFLILVALLLTGSRGATIAAGLGLFVL